MWFKFILGLWAVLNQGSVPDYGVIVKTIKKRIKIINYPDFLYTVEGTLSSKKPRLTGRELQGKDSNGSGIRYFIRLLYL